MYCTAGVLLSQGQSIYRDFSYPSQLPYHPLLLAALYKGLGTTHYLLVGRLVSAVLRYPCRDPHPPDLPLRLRRPPDRRGCCSAWRRPSVRLQSVRGLCRRVRVEPRCGDPVRRPGPVAVRDHRFPEAVPLLAGRARSACLLTLATCMRVTTALVELVFLGATFWMAGGSLRNRMRTALPFLAGALAADDLAGLGDRTGAAGLLAQSRADSHALRQLAARDRNDLRQGRSDDERGLDAGLSDPAGPCRRIGLGRIPPPLEPGSRGETERQSWPPCCRWCFS